MPELAVDNATFRVDCRCDPFPRRNLSFGPDPRGIVATGSIPCDDGCLAYNEGTRNTSSLFIVFLKLSQ